MGAQEKTREARTNHGSAPTAWIGGPPENGGATVWSGDRPDETRVRQAEAEVALEWKPGDVILGLYEVRRVAEGVGEDTEEKDYHEGGFGRVYKVFHRGWNMELAVKTPRREAFDSEAKKANFLRECETWIGLGLHPHVASCFYVRELGGVPRVFSEYAGAGTLSDWIRYRRLYEGEEKAVLARMLDIAIQFAWGLQHAHEQGLVHQDVKPLNLLMMQDGTAKVTDFGLARARALPSGQKAGGASGAGGKATVLVTQAGGLTPAYCSPEQAAGGKLTRRTDVWSWAVSLLEMFQGGVSWQSGALAAGALDQFLAHNGEEEGIPPMPDGVAALLRQCLRENPDQRPHDMNDVVRELVTAHQAAVGTPHPRPAPKAAAASPDSLNNRGVSMQDLGRLDQAETLWTRAIELDPAHLAATYNLALLQWRAAKITDEQVVRRLQETLKGQPAPRARYLLAMVHAERLDFESAVRELELAATAAPNDAEIHETRRRMRPLRDQGARMLRTFSSGGNSVGSVSLDPDARHLMTGAYGGEGVGLWDVATGACLHRLHGHAEHVTSLSFDATGRLALSASSDGTLKLWDLVTGACLRTIQGPAGFSGCATLSTDGRFVLLGLGDGTLELRDAASGQGLRQLRGHTDDVTCIAITPDAALALSGSQDATVRLWNLATGACLRVLAEHSAEVCSVCLGADGRLAASAGWDGLLRIWDLPRGQCLRTMAAPPPVLGDPGFRSVCLSADGRLVVSSGFNDPCLRLWQVASGRCLRTLRGPADAEHAGLLEDVRAVCLSPDGRVAASGAESAARVWALGPTQPPLSPPEICRATTAAAALTLADLFDQALHTAARALSTGHYGQALACLRKARALDGYERDGRALALWQKLAPAARRTRLRGAWALRTLAGQAGRVLSAGMTGDASLVLSGANDGTLRVWDAATGRCVRELGAREGDLGGERMGEVSAVSLSADGRHAVSGDLYKNVRLWNVRDGVHLRTLGRLAGAVRAVELSPDGRRAYSACRSDGAYVWNVATGECLRTFPARGPEGLVCATADGRVVLTDAVENGIAVWDGAGGGRALTLAGHTNHVHAVCLGRDGRLALSGSADRTLRLWDLSTGRCLRVLEGHGREVNAVALSADGKCALSGSGSIHDTGDNSVRVWDATTGECLHVFEGHEGPVRAVCVSADWRYVLSASDDKTLRLWELDWELEVEEGKPAREEREVGADPGMATDVPTAEAAQVARPRSAWAAFRRLFRRP